MHDMTKTTTNLPDERLIKRASLPLNDIGNAERLLPEVKDKLIYVIGRDWGVRTLGRFTFEGGRERAKNTVECLPALIKEEAEAAELAYKFWSGSNILQSKNSETALRRFATRCGNMTAIGSALNALRSRLLVNQDQLDNKPHLLQLNNGTLDLHAFASTRGFPKNRKRSMDLMAEWSGKFFGPHRLDHVPTKASSVAYDPTATAPKWCKSMETIFPDKDIRNFAQLIAGMLLYGANTSQVLFFFKGPGGNGKSTFLRALCKVLGEYQTPCYPEVFLRSASRDAGSARPEEQSMPGARLLLVSEVPAEKILSGSAIKSFTGGDPRQTRGLQQATYTFTPTAVPIMQFNRTPLITEEDEGLRRRICILPFDVSLHLLPEHQRKSPQEVNRDIDAELPGILNWMLEGFKRYWQAVEAGRGEPLGLCQPDRCTALKEQVFEQADPVGTFLAHFTCPDPTSDLLFRDVCKRYAAWAHDAGMPELSNKRIRWLLNEKGCNVFPQNGCERIEGFTWTDLAEVHHFAERK